MSAPTVKVYEPNAGGFGHGFTAQVEVLGAIVRVNGRPSRIDALQELHRVVSSAVRAIEAEDGSAARCCMTACRGCGGISHNHYDDEPAECLGCGSVP